MNNAWNNTFNDIKNYTIKFLESLEIRSWRKPDEQQLNTLAKLLLKSGLSAMLPLHEEAQAAFSLSFVKSYFNDFIFISASGQDNHEGCYEN